MAKRVTYTMGIYEACLFVASMRERKDIFTGKTIGYPCSITDKGDGTAIVITVGEAMKEWDERKEYSSPCVYWP